MIAFSSWSLPSIDAKPVELLLLVLPFVVGLFASRLFYGWVSRAGLQSAGFLPTAASILTTPLIAVAYYMVFAGFFPFYAGSIVVLAKMLFVLVLFSPIVIPLSIFLVIYLRGGLRKNPLAIILCVTAVVLVILEFAGLWLFAKNLE